MRSANRVQCSLAAEFALVNENILIQDERITQLYVIQSKYDPFLWFGLLFVDTGIYMGSVIRFNMVISSSYPDRKCPKIFLDPIPYHPLVDPDTGELDTKHAFPDWNSNTHKLHQLLSFVKRVVHQAEIYISQIKVLLENNQVNAIAEKDRFNEGIFQSDIINSFNRFEHTLECIRLYENDRDEFRRLTNIFKEKCCHQLYKKPTSIYGDDDNALVFSPWDPHLHRITKESILEGRFKPTNLLASYHKETDRVSFVPGSESA